jgi:RNA binding exosome subunit
MKLIHNIKISVLFDEKNKEVIKNTLLKILPKETIEDLNNKKLKISEELIKGENNLMMYKLNITKNKQCNLFFENLINNLDKEYLEDKITKRIDENCKLFIRLDKDNLASDKYNLTYCGNCFHIKMTIASYPKKKEIAQEMLIKEIKKIKN